MCDRQQCIEILTNAIPYLRKKFGVKSLCLFGSTARGDNREDSDVDIMVDMPAKALVMVDLHDYLEELLGGSVDLIRRHSHIDEFLIKEVERDGISIIQ